MKEMMAYRFRLYPTPEQEQMFLQFSGSCRKVYNEALGLYNAAFAQTGFGIPKSEMKKKIPEWKEQMPYLKEALSQPIQQAIHDLYDGWDRFFKGQNEKPTFRRFSGNPSFRLPQPTQFTIRNLPGTKKTMRYLYMPKMLGDPQVGGGLVIKEGKLWVDPKKDKMSINEGKKHTQDEHYSGAGCLRRKAVKIKKAKKAEKIKKVKMSAVAFVQHRPIDGKIKSATVKREGGMWYVSFLVERRVKKPVVAFKGWLDDTLTKGAVDEVRIRGVDRNTAKNGACVTDLQQFFGVVVQTKERVEKLARLQQALSVELEALRAANGIAPGGSLKGIKRTVSVNLAQARVTKYQGYLARVRKDVAHKISRALVNMSDVLVFEDLDTKALTAKAHDALKTTAKEKAESKKTRKAILDVGWGMIEGFAAYKAAQDGKRLVLVDPAYTSQQCCGCGYTDKKNKVGANVFICTQCKKKMNAHVNASINIRKRGIGVLEKEFGWSCRQKISLGNGVPAVSADVPHAKEKSDHQV